MNPFAGGLAGTRTGWIPARGNVGAFPLTSETPAPTKGPDVALWVAAIGGAVVLGGLVAVVVLYSPAEAPGAREYHRRRRPA